MQQLICEISPASKSPNLSRAKSGPLAILGDASPNLERISSARIARNSEGHRKRILKSTMAMLQEDAERGHT